MKKFISILLIGLILLQTSDISFDDIIKINNLYEHAVFHKKMYGDNFWQFLSEHYGDNTTGHQNDHKEHQNLPLKHVQDSMHAHVTLTHSFCNYTLSIKCLIEKKTNFFYNELFTSFKNIKIFQPPRFA